MNTRGKKLLNLVLESQGKNDNNEARVVENEDSPFDDSDADPDYNPQDFERHKRSTLQYFNEIDTLRPFNDNSFQASQSKPTAIGQNLINYTDMTQVFPSLEIWQTAGLSVDERNVGIERANLVFTGTHVDQTNLFDEFDKDYFQLETMHNQPLPSLNLEIPNLQKCTDGTMSLELLNNCSLLQEIPINNSSPRSSHNLVNSVENIGETSFALDNNLFNSSLQSSPVQMDQEGSLVEASNSKTDSNSVELGKSARKRVKKVKTTTEKVLLPACKITCRKKCFERFTADQRQTIFDYFQKLEYGQRQMFLDKYITKMDVKYRKVDAATNKQFSVKYQLPLTNSCNKNLTKLSDEILHMPQPSEIPIESNNDPIDLCNTPNQSNAPKSEHVLPFVCKTMFMHTIGLKSDSIITDFFRRTANDVIPSLKDRRGSKRGAQMKDISEENYKRIKLHIDSYHPQVSHYNMNHAPHRKYLSSDLSIKDMHNNFNSKHNKLSYETYRRVFDKENISFATPTQDDCSICSVYKQHSHPERKSAVDDPNKENVSNNDQCSICNNYKTHKQRYTVARRIYQEDTSKKWGEDYELYAVDMQKVLILPKMTIKNSFFVSRLVVFHETFANLQPGGENMCILWHEAIMGRNGPDVVSSYYNALVRLRETTKHVIFWADNCTAQNKNWTLFSSCIIFVNENWGPESLTFKYFEPGHSFMKADSIHGQIGKKWRKTPNVLDFEDLEKLIKSSNKFNSVLTLRAEDFKLFENGCAQRKKTSSLPKLTDIKSVKFIKGSNKMFYKLELEQDEFIEVPILKPKFKIELPKSVERERGLNTIKKQTILKELVPHMPPRKQIFWSNLPNSDEQEDLGKSVAQF